MLVSLPNISDNAADIVDAELNLSQNGASESDHTGKATHLESGLQISIENTPTPGTQPTSRKVGNPDNYDIGEVQIVVVVVSFVDYLGDNSEI